VVERSGHGSMPPGATLEAPVPGFAYFASCYVLGAIAFAFIAMETRGRTIDEIDAMLTSQARSVATGMQPAS
jgi:hypothetical protein